MYIYRMAKCFGYILCRNNFLKYVDGKTIQAKGAGRSR